MGMLMSVNKLAACIILLAACGDAEERDCAVGQDTQNGYYTLHLAEHGGDCGRVWETVDTIITNGAPLPPDDRAGCSLNTSKWEANSCTTRTTFDCNDAGFWEMQMDWIVSSHQDRPDVVFGSLRLQAVNSSFPYVCESVYYFEGFKN